MQDLRLGTPKTIREAVMRCMSLPTTRADEAAVQAIKDFLAQKFTNAMIRNPDEEDVLNVLFKDIFRE